MAPPYTHKPSLKPIEKGIHSQEDVVLADLGWGYKRISKKTGVLVARVHQQKGSVRILSILSASQLHPVHPEK